MRIPVPQLSSLTHLLLEKLPFFALATASGVITVLVQRHSGTMSSVSYLPLSVRVGNALVSCVCYLGKMVWPDHLAVFYPYHTWAVWQVTGSAALLALITLATVWQAQRRPFLVVGWLWFLGTLVPVIGLVQVGMQAMADRYTYVPLIGVFVMIVWGGKELGGCRPAAQLIRRTVTAAALAACLMATNRQLHCWRNSETLCRHALAVTTHNVMMHFLLGQALIDEGKINESVKQLNEALEVTSRFPLQMTVWYGETHCELAMALARQGKIQEAIDHYQEALRSNPDLPLALNNLAWILATTGDPKIRNGAEAVQIAESACTLTHYQKTAYIGTLAAAYAEAGRFDDAIKTAEKAIASASAAGETNLLEKNRQLLELYRAGHPYREPVK
jgi:Tfp pilus assembly protein PilF